MGGRVDLDLMPRHDGRPRAKHARGSVRGASAIRGIAERILVFPQKRDVTPQGGELLACA